jgi:hypothetical protein
MFVRWATGAVHGIQGYTLCSLPMRFPVFESLLVLCDAIRFYVVLDLCGTMRCGASALSPCTK